MKIPKLIYEKKINKINEEDLRKYLTKCAKTIEIKDDVLEGKKAVEKKSYGKEVKGENNYFLGRISGYKYTD